MEEDQISENVEAAPQQSENHEMPVEQVAKVETPVEDKQERNFKAMRKRQDELERKLKEKDEMLDRYLHMHMTQQASQQPQEVDELDAISDDEFIPKGKVNKLVEKKAARIAQDIARQETEKFMKQHNELQFLDRLKKQYSDFDQVVNSETLSILEEQEPELAQTIADLKDPYKIGISSYKYIKALNLSEKSDDVRRAKEVEKKLEKNAKTVQTPQAYEKRPMAQAFKLTDSEKAKIYQEMMGYASQAGFSY